MRKTNRIMSTITFAIVATILFGFSEANVAKHTNKSSIDDDLGKKIFTSNGCTACHQVDTKTVGPSIKTIAIAYKENKKGLISFFKGTGKVIIDPAMEAVMKPQIEVTKKMSSNDQVALADYILSIK